MHLRALLLTLTLLPASARAVGPTVAFTPPAPNETPSTFGALPFPNDLYFDGGQPADGDGTLLDAATPTIGLGAQVMQQNAAAVEEAFDQLDGFGTTTAIFFFLSGPLDAASLPVSPVLSPSLEDPVFCADMATATPVPIALRFDVDARIPNVLAVLPLPGRPLAAHTRYLCAVRRSVTGGGEPVEPSAGWLAVRDGAGPNADADAIHDPAVATLVGHGVPAAEIAGLTVFTTQSTVDDLLAIQGTVLPGLALPTANFTSRPELVFIGADAVNTLLGPDGHDHIATVATGFYESPRFTTHDPDGDGPLADLPDVSNLAVCTTPCETVDEAFTRDAQGRPAVVDVPEIPFTVVIPTGTPPANGWPVIIQQHGLGGQRDTVVLFAEADAAAGFASIGIDADVHGYRYVGCGPGAVCASDAVNGFGGTAVPDGIADGPIVQLTVQLGFFEAFHNFVAIRDHFRQTYADLLSLMRLIQGGSIDGPLGTKLDAANVFYMGHSLGGLMGSGFVPIEPGLRAALLNATGGGLTTQLFVNSSIGGGALAQVRTILGLDAETVYDAFALQPNLTQTIIDPADGINSAALLLDPEDGPPRNVLQVEDYGDQVVPNQASDALAVAAGLALMEPFVENLPRSPVMLPLAPRTISGNAAGGATAALLQNGPATHAQSILTIAGTLTFVPGFSHAEDYLLTGDGFPTLVRGVRVPNAGIFDAVLAWFRDIVDNGPPGTFTFAGDADYNPVQNLDVPSGASTQRFFARTVGAGGMLARSEATPDVLLEFTANTAATRVTAARSLLGATDQADDADLPPGPDIAPGTAGVLPFFVGLQRQIAGTFRAELTIAYTAAELAAAGVVGTGEERLVVARFEAGTCTVGGAGCAEDGDCGSNGPCVGARYTPALRTTIDTAAHAATAQGIGELGVYAVLATERFALAVAGGGNAATDCRATWQVVDPSGGTSVTRGRRTETVPSCVDGEAGCDADGVADGTCTFRVAVCLNGAADGCTAQPITGYALRAVGPRKRRQLGRTNAAALLQTLTVFGAERRSPRRTAVRFRPAFADPGCGAFADVGVPAGARPTVALAGQVVGARGRLDTDRLTLFCRTPGTGG